MSMGYGDRKVAIQCEIVDRMTTQFGGYASDIHDTYDVAAIADAVLVATELSAAGGGVRYHVPDATGDDIRSFWAAVIKNRRSEVASRDERSPHYALAKEYDECTCDEAPPEVPLWNGRALTHAVLALADEVRELRKTLAPQDQPSGIERC